MITCIFTKALQFRQSGRYGTMGQRMHLETLIDRGHIFKSNQTKQTKKQTKGVNHAVNSN